MYIGGVSTVRADSDLGLLEDHLWSSDFVLLRCFSHDGLGFQHASLWEKPSRRLRDQPENKREMEMIYCRDGLKGQVANSKEALTLGFQHEMWPHAVCFIKTINITNDPRSDVPFCNLKRRSMSLCFQCECNRTCECNWNPSGLLETHHHSGM